ncbi:MAG TPA: DUF6624 domain-containing protein [Thermoanaerobaculia bacterium]|jgi:hypothetical protein
MKRALFHAAIFALLPAWSASSLAGKVPPKVSMPASLVGAWEEIEGARRLNIEPGRAIEREGDNLSVRGLIRSAPNRLVLRNNGLSETWAFKIEKGLLTLEPLEGAQESDGKGVFRRLDHIPPDLKLEPLPVSSAKALSPERIQAIQKEVKERFDKEQVLLKSPSPPQEQIVETKRNNLGYLTDLLKEVGWLDSARFGAKTSVQAVIMAKHTHDLRLMMTLLPYAEHDLKDSGDGQTYAVLYDALQLELGRKQLYGTQVAKDKNDGHFFVLPMQESKAQVNLRLAKMKLPSIDEYLEVMRQVYGQKPQCCRQDG